MMRMAVVAIEPRREVADWLRLRSKQLGVPVEVHPDLDRAGDLGARADLLFLAGFLRGAGALPPQDGRPGPFVVPFIRGADSTEDRLDRWSLFLGAVRARLVRSRLEAGESEPWVGRDFEEEMEERHRELLRCLNPVFVDLAKRDPSIREHSFRVGVYAARIGEVLGLPAIEVRLLQLGGWVHDVGKTRIRTQILVKRGPLEPEEWVAMRKHPTWGRRLVDSHTADPEIIGIVLHHHERFDGKGYPAGLVGERIPLLARILAVADAYDAITSDRPYRRASGHRRAVREILAGAGTRFDPGVVQAFLTARLDRLSLALFAA
jgi:HD-GYP domain-containing protein (c-di-GMP phosphodiesterase class II)